MRKLLVLLSLFILSTSQLFAGGGNNVSNLTAVWGGGSISTCNLNGIEGSEACIGQSVSTSCATFKHKGSNANGFAILMLVAKQVKEQGAYFCPVQVETDNKDTIYNAWTVYGDVTNSSDANCFWLCRDGYTGATCSESDSNVTSCDSTPLLRSNFDNISVGVFANIENSVAMFDFDEYKRCQVGKSRGKEEHDMILAITRWLPNGHGAFVRQMVVRAEAEKEYRNRKSSPAIYPAQNSTEILVCKNGYKPNANGDSCEPIDTNLCMKSDLCTGWTDMDENIHDFKLDATKNCYQFRCINNKEAFVSGADRTCAECVTSPRNGVSPVNGVCIRCDKGKIFDANAKSSGYCSEAIAYSKTDLMYGKGKTKNSVPNIDDQCWTLTTPDEYKKCVTEQTSASND